MDNATLIAVAYVSEDGVLCWCGKLMICSHYAPLGTNGGINDSTVIVRTKNEVP